MLDVQSVSARKPLFLDESAHDWRHVELGRSLGWTGGCIENMQDANGGLVEPLLGEGS